MKAIIEKSAITAYRANVADAGSCHACDSTGIDPPGWVFVIRMYGVEVRLCESCWRNVAVQVRLA